MLAVLKAGGACVGLDARRDVNEPAFVMSDARPVLVLTAERLAARADFLGARVLTVESARDDEAAAEGSEKLEDLATPDSLAYVLYADAPLSELRGVALTHRAVAEAMAWQPQGDFAPGEGDRVGVEFEAGVGEYGPAALWPLLSGAALVVSRGADETAGDDARVNVIITDRARLDASAAASGGARLVRVGDFERFEVEGRLGEGDGTTAVRGAYARPGAGGAICQLVSAHDERGRAPSRSTRSRGCRCSCSTTISTPRRSESWEKSTWPAKRWRAATSTRRRRRPRASSRTRTPRRRARDSSRPDWSGGVRPAAACRAAVRAAPRIKVGGSLVSLDDVTSVLARPPRSARGVRRGARRGLRRAPAGGLRRVARRRGRARARTARVHEGVAARTARARLLRVRRDAAP